ncbi:MAG: type III pantothenate kinase [Nitrospirae bacterium]|nr:type III pantothenate kinase [Nitrospirota bacterium]
MLLAVDIGNSTIAFGLFPDPLKGDNLFVKKIPTRPARSVAAYKKLIYQIVKPCIPDMPRRCIEMNPIVSSVVPEIEHRIIEALKKICLKEPLIINHKLKGGLTFKISSPREVGSDRIANAVAGFHCLMQPVAIVDFGSATTITVVGSGEVFLGGAILPGIELMRRSLHEWTSKLPFIPLEPAKKTIGGDTISSISSGIINGTASAIDGLILKMEKEAGFKLKLVLTGGLAGLISPFIKRRHKVIPYLTFEGMRLIYLKQRSREGVPLGLHIKK